MKQEIQYLLALVMCTAGMVMIFLCVYIDPKGELDASILVAYGEILTFVGAIFGIDFKYRYQNPSK